MAVNISSILELRERQETLPEGQKPKPSYDDLLYLVHGIGSDRDHVFTLAEVAAFLGINFEAHKIHYLGNMDSTESIPKVGGWKVYTSTDITEAEFGYGQLVFEYQLPSGDLPSPSNKGAPSSIVIPSLIARSKSTFKDDVTFEKKAIIGEAELSYSNNVISFNKKIASANGFEGPLTGNVTGDVTGNVKSGTQADGLLKFEHNKITHSKNNSVTGTIKFGKDNENDTFEEDRIAIYGRTQLDRPAVNTSNIITADDEHTSIDLTSSSFRDQLVPKEGDIVIVKNSSSSSVNVTIREKMVSSTRMVASVSLDIDCAMAFVCVGKLGNQDVYLWNPLCNTTVSWQ